MKNKVLTILTLISLNSHAVVMSDESLRQQGAHCIEAFPGCFLTSTLILPSMIVSDQELDLKSEESFMRLYSEAMGDTSPILTEILSQDLEVSTQQIMNEVKFLESLNERSVDKLILNLTNHNISHQSLTVSSEFFTNIPYEK